MHCSFFKHEYETSEDFKAANDGFSNMPKANSSLATEGLNILGMGNLIEI
jgi:hypothetical protein